MIGHAFYGFRHARTFADRSLAGPVPTAERIRKSRERRKALAGR